MRNRLLFAKCVWEIAAMLKVNGWLRVLNQHDHVICDLVQCVGRGCEGKVWDDRERDV